MDPASSPPWIYLFNILSAGACRSSTSSRCCALEYSISRFRRCATRASWSARTSTRASCRSSFSFASHFLQLCRHAGRRKGFLRRPSPHAQPSHSSPFSHLPSSLYSFPRPGRGCGWMWVGREGGRGHPRAHRHLFHLTFTRRSPYARPGARSTLARLLHVDTADAAVVTERARGGRPFLPSVWVP